MRGEGGRSSGYRQLRWWNMKGGEGGRTSGGLRG